MIDRIRSWCSRVLGFGAASQAKSIDQLQSMAAKMNSGTEWLEATTPPNKSDFTLIGAFVQTYAIADFNARRTIDGMRSIRGESGAFAGHLNDTDVLIHLRREATAWSGHKNVRAGILKALDILEMHRIHRHHLAHWVVRRYPRFRGFIVISNNAPEAAKRDGIAIGPGEAKWGIFTEDLFRVEMEKLQRHSDYLAKLAMHIEVNGVRLQKEHHPPSS